MQMKNPPHPGALVGDSLGELGWTITAGARGLAMSRQQLHNVISGRSAVTPELAVKLERALGGTADAWLRMQNAYDLARLSKDHSNVRAIRRFTPKDNSSETRQ